MDRDQAQDVLVESESKPDETDGDITMADVNPMPPPEEEKKDSEEEKKDVEQEEKDVGQEKKDIKLEDLFADDSDDEFPSTDKTTQSQGEVDSSADDM